jgi:hypothetical protein
MTENMTETWTRRQLLRRTGTVAAGVAGLGLAGCGTRGAAGPAVKAAASGGAPVAEGVRSFVSRPDLRPPAVTITHPGQAPGDPAGIFLTPPASGPGQGGAMICDRQGELVWFSPDSASGSKLDFRPQAYQGATVLTYFQGLVTPAGYGEGAAVIADASYRTIHTVHAAHGLQADLHEFVLTPQGTALITAYRDAPADLTALGGPARGRVLSGVLQEIDVATGKLLFEWDSLDHVAVTDTYQKFSGGTAGQPFDYFHINSIAVAPDGDLIISSRNTWAVYKIARPGGTIAWRLNGKKSSFAMGAGTRFYWQHMARPDGASTLTLFDDGSAPPQEKQSRALILDLDTAAMRATLKKAFVHPGKTLLATAMGSAELLPDGRMFVGWGTEPYFSEFAPDGTLLLDGAITAGDPSYRAFTAGWTGHPAELPAAAARSRAGGGATVYASWNGATDTAAWTVLAGKTATALTRAGTAVRSGFETAIAVDSAGPYFAVEPRDASGRTQARSAAVRLG